MTITTPLLRSLLTLGLLPLACKAAGANSNGAPGQTRSERSFEPSTPASAGSYRGTWDDLPIAADDLLGLEQLLRAKWTFFLFQMDAYNRARSRENNEAMSTKMGMVFAERFEFHAYQPDGSEFGDVQGTYSPREWVQANDAEKLFGKVGPLEGLLVPNYDHVLTVEQPGKRVILEGYHEHAFVGAKVRLAVGDARHLAEERIVFEKIDEVWRVTEYQEVNWGVSEMASPKLPIPGAR